MKRTPAHQDRPFLTAAHYLTTRSFLDDHETMLRRLLRREEE